MGQAGKGEKLTAIPCNLCGSSDADELSLVDRDGKHLRTVICRNCGLVWTDPRPADIRDFYEREYRLRYKGTYRPKPKHIYRAGKVAIDRYGRIKEHISKGMSLLDVGSGGGEFIYIMRKQGCKVTGIEPNEGYARYAISEYDLDVHVGFLQDVQLEEDSRDVVTMWHVLEHTEDPASTLERICKWIRPGGILVVEVPNVEATCQAPAHRFHIAHLYNFNPETLRGMGEKAGLTAIKQDISEDGGNITAIFKKDERKTPSCGRTIQGNYDRIAGIVRGHEVARHYTSHHPYLRFIRKICRTVAEKIATANVADGKRLLDRLCGNEAA